MLKTVKFSNFRMFKNETIIDLVPTKSEILKDSNIEECLLKGGLFYGGNASGKTTALHAISLLLDLLFKEFVFDENNICKFSKDKIAKFEYTFTIDNNEIVYYFSLKEKGNINEEKLFVNNEELINRIGSQATTILIDNDSTQSVDSATLYLRMIYFSSKFVNYPILSKWMTFLSNSIYIDNLINKLVTFNNLTFKETNIINYLEKNGEGDINEFFTHFNIPFQIKYEKVNVMGNIFPNITFTNLKTNCIIPVNMESYGNKLLLQLLPYILTIKKTGGMLLIDEFGGGLHNKLAELLVNYLFKETKNTQIFIVTHETNLLKTNIIRPDQIFIVDYNKDGSFISKASNQSPRESQNLEKMYLGGVFGGIPLYDENK